MDFDSQRKILSNILRDLSLKDISQTAQIKENDSLTPARKDTHTNEEIDAVKYFF